MDAAARPGRLSRGDAHAPLRHPDLRALGHRARGHHAVRPQAPSQHRALRVEGEAGAARAVLQRGRPRRLRHPRLRHRRGGHARPPVDRRPRAHPAQGAVVRARDADLQAGGSARGPVDRQLPVRPALRHPGEEPEHAGREPADAAWQGQRAHADDHLCRTARTADARPRNARPARAGPGAQPRRSAADVVLGAERALQQPQLLVSAGAGERLRDRAHPDFSAAGGGLRRERRARSRFPGDSRGQRSGAEPEDLRVHRGAAAALPRLHPEPLRARRDRNDRVRGDGRARHRGQDLPHPQSVGRSQPEAGAARPRGGDARRRHRAVLRVDHRRLALLQLYRRRRRKRFTRRAQPGLFRDAQPAAPVVAAGVAQRSGGIQQLSRLLHRARARAPVVGTGGRLAQLPRAVAQRGVRAVLRRAVRAASEGR